MLLNELYIFSILAMTAARDNPLNSGTLLYLCLLKKKKMLWLRVGGWLRSSRALGSTKKILVRRRHVSEFRTFSRKGETFSKYIDLTASECQCCSRGKNQFYWRDWKFAFCIPSNDWL
jgi:hypothetical protein